MKLTLQREPSQNGCTHGTLSIDGQFECFVLEDEIREIPNKPVAEWKVPGKTAIPAGHYGLIVDFSQRFKRLMPHIIGVPGFDGVRIHSGNTADQTEGCILVGCQKTPTSVVESFKAFTALFDKLVATEQMTIDVLNPEKSGHP